MDYTTYTDKAKTILATLFDDETERDTFRGESWNWPADGPEDELTKLAFTLMSRIVGPEMPREEVLRIHAADEAASRNLLDRDFLEGQGKAEFDRHREKLERELYTHVTSQVVRNLAPVLNLPVDHEAAKAHLAMKTARMRRHHPRMRELDSIVIATGERLLETLSDPDARASLQRTFDKGRTQGSRRVASELVDMVWPDPMPRAFVIGLLSSDDELGTAVDTLMVFEAMGLVAQAIERECEAELQRYFNLHCMPDPGYADSSPDDTAAP
jgi:hypothetical protein